MLFLEEKIIYLVILFPPLLALNLSVTILSSSFQADKKIMKLYMICLIYILFKTGVFLDRVLLIAQFFFSNM